MTSVSFPRSASRSGITVSYEFTLVLVEPERSGDDADALYAQFNDGSTITTGEVTRIEFEREDRSGRDAILSAFADVRQAGFRVVRVQSDLLETLAAINAELAASR